MKINYSKVAFSKSSLPSNRKEQFFDIVSHRWRQLLVLGLLIALFSVPFIASIVFKDIYVMAINVAEDMDYSDKVSNVFFIQLVYSVCLLISFPILGLGLTGVSSVIKNMIYDEPIFLMSDFKEGIKESYKSQLPFYLIVSVFYSVASLFEIIFSNEILRVIPFAFNFGLVLPICFVALFLAGFYKNTFGVNLKCGILVYFRNLFKVLLGFISIIICLFVSLITNMPIKMLVIVIILIVYIPYSLLLSSCLFTSIFDEMINVDQFPDYYKKGIYNPKNDK